MEYRGQYGFFDAERIVTYPLSSRSNKVTRDDLLLPDSAMAQQETMTGERLSVIEDVAKAAIQARSKQRAVMCFTGAHLIKNGMGPLLADLIERKFLTLVAGNGATAIHDFELAEISETSENVPNALPEGRFGMAREFAWLNAALRLGNLEKLGFGESLGRCVEDVKFRTRVELLCNPPPPEGTHLTFRSPEYSVLARAYRCGIPMTIHAGIGTDVLDQHPSFDGEVKGGTSGRDFLIYAQEARRLAGGMVLNIGSAVTGPEVLLKAVSMAANVGDPANGLTTADFDIRPCLREHMGNESKFGYYFRDQKSVFSRVPEAFGGKGYYVEGDIQETFPALYRALRRMRDHS